jgi:beta-phosphoglucomutase-like phosphatase (HAD superfamily)
VKRLRAFSKKETLMIPIRGIILDADGTFIDSNDAHAKSWTEAMAAYAYNVAF